jgi:hypothetical protein
MNSSQSRLLASRVAGSASPSQLAPFPSLLPCQTGISCHVDLARRCTKCVSTILLLSLDATYSHLASCHSSSCSSSLKHTPSWTCPCSVVLTQHILSALLFSLRFLPLSTTLAGQSTWPSSGPFQRFQGLRYGHGRRYRE